MKFYTVTQLMTILDKDGTKYNKQVPLSFYSTMEDAELNLNERLNTEIERVKYNLLTTNDSLFKQDYETELLNLKYNLIREFTPNGKLKGYRQLFLIQEIKL